MSLVFELEEDNEYFPLYGLVTDLAGFKICARLSKIIGVELTHELAYEKKHKAISLSINNETIFFDKYIWADKGSEHRIELIHNIASLPAGNSKTTNPMGLFQDELFEEQVFLLQEWKEVRYIIKVEGENCFFKPQDLKKISGVRMVLEEPIEKFKEYNRIL
mgnify:CR=1 FL=1